MKSIVTSVLIAAGLTAQGTWLLRNTATTARVLPGMAYDSLRSRMLVFGSSNGGAAAGQLLSWDGSSWTLVSAAAPLGYGRMAYDPVRDRLVAVEGTDFALFNGTSWSSSAPIPGLPGGGGVFVSAVAFDSHRGRVVAFVDQFNGRNIAEWDGSAWTLPVPAAAPAPRLRTCMAFDPVRHVCVVFGGRSGVDLDDTWEWDGTNWQQRTPATSPPPRWYAQMTWHAGLGRVVLFGGERSTAPLNDMWAWDGTSWQQVLPTLSPPNRARHAMAYDPTRNRIVLGFGQGGASLADTWEFVAGGTAPRDVELIDLDNDGDLDVATANETSDNVSLRSNNGAGTLGSESTVSLTPSDHAPVALVRCDLDNDGSRDDLAVVCETSGTLVLITNPGSAAPTVLSQACGGSLPSCAASGDLDGNPIDDLVLGCQGEPFAGGAGLFVVRNGGAAVGLPIPAPHPTQVVKVALGDLDGDGDLDLAALALGSSDELLLFAGDGAGAFTFAGALPVASSGLANGLCLTDLDRDGRNDLVVAQPQLFPPSQTLRVWRRTSNGALAPGLFVAGSDVSTPGSFALDLSAGDLEDDSIPGFLARVDVAVANAGSGTVTIQHGFTGSAFSSVSSPSVGTNPVAVAVGDLNGDGCADVVVANQGSDDVTVLLTTPPALAQTYGTGCGGPTIAAVGLPTLGNAAFAVRVSNARPVAPVLMLFAPGAQDTPLLPSSCHLLLSNPILQFLVFSNGSGQATLTVGVPATPSLQGADVFFQGAVFHAPGGAFADTLDFSNALRLQVGQ